MKAVGLITEYNPMHTGHIYHLKQSIKLSGADVSIAVMSGNFVQRGEPAIVNKYLRAKAAIDSGINLVVELPPSYAVSSAETFAQGSISILNALSVDSICFGSEAGNIDILTEIADILCDEPLEFRSLISGYITDGFAFPLARQKALQDYITTHAKYNSNNLADVLSMPNNILAIEYLKAIRKNHCNIKPIALKRIGSNYNDSEFSSEIPSASALRAVLNSKNTFIDNQNAIKGVLPDTLYQWFEEYYIRDNASRTISINDFSILLSYKLTQIKKGCNNNKQSFIDKLCEFPDISESIANRIYSQFTGFDQFSDFILKIKTKQYTYSRISRCLLRIILDIKGDLPKYIRILGFDSKGQQYLKSIKKDCSFPLITKPALYKNLLYNDAQISNIYEQIHVESLRNQSCLVVPSYLDEFQQNVYIKR